MNGLLTEHWPAARQTMFRLYAERRIRVTFDEPGFRGLASVFDAVERLLSGRSLGKVVVNLQPQ
jgi:NADPH-dependent curcumin reductase CurA